ncbi:diphthamide biosynthesis protein [Grosmannia clavigera kw1407]|uniref:2-(3-amino-3-carboxypropyl)histidine synthase subunit 2 n=1 Tax=Grosmannia clavigera (strain kw1407 / UAMH 11150) TaxID=655863 RepID=F0XHU1_GROCL|nr:diphthamide biosynthesis protein [Grosmannia clavigera kw1407]EFX02692.1 diphthamide biosynthesis protein [Grosmannia clavigera kw1407]
MAELTAAPVLSTPAENLFEAAEPLPDFATLPRRSDDELREVYEISRTAREIHAAKRRRIALQFPDTMLGDAPRVVGLLGGELAAVQRSEDEQDEKEEAKIYILADTSYSACCVDEVAAEHADADVVVHYGRSCLSPTSRLPVIYVFTRHPLDEAQVVAAFVREFPDPADARPVILMADVTYQDHVPAVYADLQRRGYAHVLSTAVVHNPVGSLPNRTMIDADGQTVADEAVQLQDCAVFHVSAPPTSLLLALAAKVQAFFVYPTEMDGLSDVLSPATRGMLGRRYAKVLRMATAGVIGILVNTLSVSNYLAAVDTLRRRIAAAGKKSYMVVVGKLNPVKLANFAEIDGWVVVGCWESSLLEDDAGFYQPVVTPFELEMALTSDEERVWGLKWWGGLEGLSSVPEAEKKGEGEGEGEDETERKDGSDDESESEVPQFDLRTGRLVTTSRPMRKSARTRKKTNKTESSADTAVLSGALALRGKAELATINGVVSPGAEFLRSQRTWQGLGTDYNDEEEEPSTLIEEGRSGIARGYTPKFQAPQLEAPTWRVLAKDDEKLEDSTTRAPMVDGKADKTAAAASSGAAVRGASLLIVLQIAARAATFVANQLLLRYLTAQLLGVATQLEVYYLSVLFFARESLRVAIQRQGGRGEEKEKKGQPGDDRPKGQRSTTAMASQSAVNLAYVSILLGAAVALLLGWLYRASTASSAVADTPFLAPALYLYGVAAVLELLSEPAFVVLQLRLRFGARAAAESVGTALRCVVTLGTAVVAARGGDIDVGVLPFALGQLAYALGLLAVYGWQGASLARQDGFSLLPRWLERGRGEREETKETNATRGRKQSNTVLSLFDRSTLRLASSMTAQSLVKHVLTQGDTFLVSVLSTPTAQGVYALANNYGGLAARLLFQPVEESSRNYFSRLLAGDEKTDKKENAASPTPPNILQASHDLQTLLRIYSLFSVVVTALGPTAAAPFLALVTGPRWAGSGAAATLAAYMWYLPLLAANGVAEAFVASVAAEADVHRQSAWMGVFSLIFAAAGFVCLRVLDAGAAGLVAANAVNMACRIVWCAVFIRRYFVARHVTFSLTKAFLPRPGTVAAGAVASMAVRRLVLSPADAVGAGAITQILQLARIAAVGLPLVVAV